MKSMWIINRILAVQTPVDGILRREKPIGLRKSYTPLFVRWAVNVVVVAFFLPHWVLFFFSFFFLFFFYEPESVVQLVTAAVRDHLSLSFALNLTIHKTQGNKNITPDIICSFDQHMTYWKMNMYLILFPLILFQSIPTPYIYIYIYLV